MLTTILAVVDPGQGTAPPGSDKLTTILSWTAWGVFALCVAGVLISAAKMAHSHQQGYGAQQQTSSLAWTCVACVVAGSASAIVGALS